MRLDHIFLTISDISAHVLVCMVFSRLQEKLGSFGGVGCGLKICQLLLSIFSNLTRQRQTVQANSLIVQWNLVGCSTESTGVKLQRWWWVFLRSEYAFYQAVNVSTHIITPHTHTHTQIMSVRSTVVITSARWLEESLPQQQKFAMRPYQTLSSCFPFPSLFLFMASSFCPFYSPARKVHHPHHLSEWYLERRSP